MSYLGRRLGKRRGFRASADAFASTAKPVFCYGGPSIAGEREYTEFRLTKLQFDSSRQFTLPMKDSPAARARSVGALRRGKAR